MTHNYHAGCSFSENINARCSCTNAERIAHDEPDPSHGKISEHPFQLPWALSQAQEEYVHSPDVMERTRTAELAMPTL